MRQSNLWAIFLLLFFIILPVQNTSAQETYNIYTLEYFKRSVENLMAGEYEKAIENSSMVIRRDATSSVAYTIRARAYYELGRYTNCINDCNQALNLDRHNTSALLLRASAYVETGNLNRAVLDWQTILRIDPDNTEAIRNLELAALQTQ
ncbi:MAG: hypothetical protein LBI12_05670 [Treponema sp.]|jgi:tetratricopeptide (TPR) repeat protein|nr:hypothetical protein [Treponema sp.]